MGSLYRAKEDGRSVFRFSRARWTHQPLAAADKTITGFGALMRWRHPIRGLVPPAEFIPIAEQSSLIVEVGDWTIAEACRVAASWPETSPLELEVTEGLLMDSAAEVTAKLEQLQKVGVTIVMDDFGTGYSSLSYLLKFPFDKIKIDRSFVSASSSDPMARDILRAIASLGKTLRLSITAEGVETTEQAEFLSEIACHQLQGFFFARPLEPTDLPQYLLANFTETQLRGPLAKTDAALPPEQAIA